jgi:uncharacterized membrane protein
VIETLLSTELLVLASVLLAPWVLFALFAAFSDACVGFVDEWLLDTLNDEQEGSANAPGKLLLISGFFGFVVALGALLLIFLIPGLVFDYSTTAWDLAILAGIIEILWLIPYFYALNQGGAVNTTPLFQSIPIFALVIGIFLFDELPTTTTLVATAIIIVGAFILNYSNELRRVNYKNILLMFTASALIALGLFVFKEAEAESNFVTAVIGNGIGMGITSLIIWLAHPIYRQQFNSFVAKFDRRVLAGQFANETLYSASALSGQMAVVLGPSVMVVSAFNAFHPIFTFIIGWTLAKFGSQTHQETLKPADLKSKLIGVMLIALGALLIVL